LVSATSKGGRTVVVMRVLCLLPVFVGMSQVRVWCAMLSQPALQVILIYQVY
jgi:hypothetical protein